MSLTLVKNLEGKPRMINNGQKQCFTKCHKTVLGLPQTMKNDEFHLTNIVAMCWTHQITLCHQLRHGRFITKITGFPNMVCMIDHTMEDLQHTL